MGSMPPISSSDASIGRRPLSGARGGIAVFAFDPETGAVTAVSEATGVDNPTFLAVHRRTARHAISEVFGWAGRHQRLPRCGAKWPAVYPKQAADPRPRSPHASFPHPQESLPFSLTTPSATGRPAGQEHRGSPVRADGGWTPAVASGLTLRPQPRGAPTASSPMPDTLLLVVVDLGADRLIAIPSTPFTALARVGSELRRLRPRHLPPSERPLAFVINELVRPSRRFDAATGASRWSTSGAARRFEASRATVEPADQPGRLPSTAPIAATLIVIHAADAATGKLASSATVRLPDAARPHDRPSAAAPRLHQNSDVVTVRHRPRRECWGGRRQADRGRDLDKKFAQPPDRGSAAAAGERRSTR